MHRDHSLLLRYLLLPTLLSSVFASSILPKSNKKLSNAPKVINLPLVNQKSDATKREIAEHKPQVENSTTVDFGRINDHPNTIPSGSGFQNIEGGYNMNEDGTYKLLESDYFDVHPEQLDTRNNHNWNERARKPMPRKNQPPPPNDRCLIVYTNRWLPVAVKTVPLNHYLFVTNVLREYEIVNKLKHPFIVHIYGKYEDQIQGTLQIVMEGTNWGDIMTLIKKNKMSLRTRLRTIMYVILAVAFMHRNGFVHRDLKIDNIIRMPDSTIRLIDFGTAVAIGNNIDTMSPANPEDIYRNIAPESFVKGFQNAPTLDVFSVGTIMFEVLTSEESHSFGPNDLDGAAEAYNKLTGDHQKYTDHLTLLPKILSKMCDLDPRTRMNNFLDNRLLGFLFMHPNQMKDKFVLESFPEYSLDLLKPTESSFTFPPDDHDYWGRLDNITEGIRIRERKKARLAKERGGKYKLERNGNYLSSNPPSSQHHNFPPPLPAPYTSIASNIRSYDSDYSTNMPPPCIDQSFRPLNSAGQPPINYDRNYRQQPQLKGSRGADYHHPAMTLALGSEQHIHKETIDEQQQQPQKFNSFVVGTDTNSNNHQNYVPPHKRVVNNISHGHLTSTMPPRSLTYVQPIMPATSGYTPFHDNANPSQVSTLHSPYSYYPHEQYSKAQHLPPFTQPVAPLVPPYQ